MVSSTWATAEQTAFLQSHFEHYMAINCGSKDYRDFWAKLKQLWFDKFPELPLVFPGVEQWQLTDSQAELITDAIKLRLKVRQVILFSIQI